MRPRRLLIRYAAGLASAYLVTVVEVAAIVAALAGRSVATAATVLSAAAIVVVGTSAVTVGAVLTIGPPLRWLRSRRPPTPAQVHSVASIMGRQATVAVVPWLVTAAVLIPLNLRAGGAVLAVLGSAILFGVLATVCTGFLFTTRTLRPLLAGVPDDAPRPRVPGVRTRLFIMWTVCTALPGTAIACLLVLRVNGWIGQREPIDLAVLVLTLVAVVLGLRATAVVSMSISDPVNDVTAAMAAVERGSIDQSIDVYEWSELGRLQSGFNRMLAGLRERRQLRDLFGRHVGEEVARRALEEQSSVEVASAGDEREVAVLFVDLVDSTRLAVDHEPHEVADILNRFFGIVVAQVDAQHGLVNKFQGDAALAVFGAPLRISDPAAAALAAADTLVAELRSLPVDFGIGVTFGPVFAGNIGAANRYEYTVVGDAVNEAARLADHAKTSPVRVLCSGTLIAAAGAAGRGWAPAGEARLRGRTTPTALYTPAGRGSSGS